MLENIIHISSEFFCRNFRKKFFDLKNSSTFFAEIDLFDTVQKC